MVVDARDGSPIAGARLATVVYPWRRLDRFNNNDPETVAGPTTSSRADGTFALRLRPGYDVALRVEAEGYAPLELVSLQPGECVRVEMSAGVRLRVRAFDEGGRAVAAAGLRLFGLGLERSGATDPSGVCAFDALPGRRVAKLESWHWELGDSGVRHVELPTEGAIEVVLVMPEGRALEGRVTDAESGSPVAGARVGLDFFLFRAVTTDAEGRYTLRGWTRDNGRLGVHVVAEGYARAGRRVGDGGAFDFAMERGDTVVGRLLDTGGRPVPAVYVAAIGSEGQDGWPRTDACWARSGEDGRFVCADLARDFPHRLIATAEGHGRLLHRFAPRDGEAGTIDLGDLVMPPSRTVAGRVIHADGSPVPRVSVRIEATNGSARSYDHAHSAERWTDDLGRFRFADVAPGYCFAEVAAPGSLPIGKFFTLAQADLLDMEFQLAAAPEFVVTVVDSEGAPIGEALVTLHTSLEPVGAETDHAGVARFCVPGRPVSVEVTLLCRGRLPRVRRERIPEGAATHMIVMEAVEIVDGVLLSPEGAGVPGGQIEVRVGGQRLTRIRTEEAGRFEVAVPCGTTCDLVLESVPSETRRLDFYTLRGRLEGIAAGTRGVSFRTERVAHDRSLRVAVRMPDGTPAPGVLIGGFLVAQTDATGLVTLEGLPDQEITLVANAPQGAVGVTYTQFSVIPAGQRIEVRLRQTLRISGVVLREDGSEAAGCAVEARLEWRLRYSAGTDPQGRFAIEVGDDEAGPFLLRARQGGKVSDLVEARPGAEGLTLRLTRDAP